MSGSYALTLRLGRTAQSYGVCGERAAPEREGIQSTACANAAVARGVLVAAKSGPRQPNGCSIARGRLISTMLSRRGVSPTLLPRAMTSSSVSGPPVLIAAPLAARVVDWRERCHTEQGVAGGDRARRDPDARAPGSGGGRGQRVDG